MKNNYFLAIILSIIFPGLVQYYLGEHQKGHKYIILYFTSFLVLFLILSLNGYTIDLDNMENLLEDAMLQKLSLIINVVFRLASGFEGLTQIYKYKKYYG